MNNLIGVEPNYLICSCTRDERFCTMDFWCSITAITEPSAGVLKERHYDCNTGELCGTTDLGCRVGCSQYL